MTIVAMSVHSPVTSLGAATALLSSIVYFALYVYIHDLSNQLTGVAEDRINKPHRPLVSGAVTARGAIVRLVAVAVVFPVYGWACGVVEWAAAWEVLIVLHNLLGLSRNWILKGLFNALGAFVQLAAAWQLVGPLGGSVVRYLVVLCSSIFLTIWIQDLRDVEGDQRTGRRTFPLVYGVTFTRYFLVGAFVLSMGALTVLMATYTVRLSLLIACLAMMWSSGALICVRLLLLRDPATDHRTYLVYTGWYCLLVLGTSAVARA